MAVTSVFVCEPIPDLAWYDRASERFVVEAELRCTPERLFEILEDPIAWTVWVPSIEKVEWTSPRPYRAGTTRTVHASGGLVVHEEFLAWEPGKLVAFMFLDTSRKLWRRMGERYEVTELGDGRCHLRWTMAYEPRGFFAWLHPMIRPLMRHSMAGMAKKLESYVANQGMEGSR